MRGRFLWGIERGESASRVGRVQVLFLLTGATLAGTLFHAPEPLADLFAILLLGALAWMLALERVSRLDPRAARVLTAALVGVSAVCILAIRLVEGPAQLAALAVWLYALDWILRRAGDAEADLPAMQLTIVLYAFFLLLYQSVPYVHWALGSVARGASSATGALTGREVSIGAGFIGLQLTILFLLHVASITIFAEKNRPALAAVAAGAAMVLANLVYAVMWTWMSDWDAVNGFAAMAQPLAAPYDYRLILLVLLLVPMVVYRKVRPPRILSATAHRRAMVVATGASATIFALLFVLGARVPAAVDGGRVVLLDSNGEMRDDLPDFDEYGLAAVGQFGLLPAYLEARGYGVEIVEELTVDAIKAGGTLVVINLRRELPEEVAQAVGEFVKRGGSLMVVGDHTGTEEIRDPSNQLLEPYGISLGFDSAIPLRDGWLNSYVLMPHPTLNGLSEREIQLGVGASLDIAPSARPLIVGRAGFSDAGDLANVENGFLGDMAYNRGEQMGDVILAAEATHGDGLVMAFGDTSFLQNLAISRSYRFVDNVFARLAARVGSRSRVSLTPAQPAWEGQPFDAPYAVIDVSHFGKAHLGRSRESIDGLVANLIRSGYSPFVMYDFSEEMLDGASILVLPSPMLPFTARETGALDTFMDEGGLLVLTTGSEKPFGSYTLLQHLGYELGGAPLGRAEAHWESHHVNFWSAWPLRHDGRSGVEVIAEAWEHPVMLSRPQGAGGSLVVGDASFLLEKNLEGLGSYDIDNIQFLRAFIDQYAEGGESDQ